MATNRFTDNPFPFPEESSRVIYYQFSSGINWDFSTGNYPSGEEDGWDWVNAFIPINHLYKGSTRNGHSWSRQKIGINGKYSLPYRLTPKPFSIDGRGSLSNRPDASTVPEGTTYLDEEGNLYIVQSGEWEFASNIAGNTWVDTAEPDDPIVDDFWYNTSDNTLYYFDGSKWVEMNLDGSTSLEAVLALSHQQNTDIYLDANNINEVSAADLRAHLDDADIHRVAINANISSTNGNVPQWSGTGGDTVSDGLGVVTTIGNPGSDTNLATEQAIREGLDAVAGGGVTSLNGLTDVTLTGPVNDEVLQYSGGFWINASLGSGASASFGTGIGDIPEIGAALGVNQTVETDGSSKLVTAAKNTGYNLNLGTGAGTVAEGNHLHTGVYEPADVAIQTHITTVTGNPHQTSVNDLTDATITTPVNDHVLTYDTGTWVNKSLSAIGIPTQLDDLTDVTITTPSANAIMQYIGGFWIDVNTNTGFNLALGTGVGQVAEGSYVTNHINDTANPHSVDHTDIYIGGYEGLTYSGVSNKLSLGGSMGQNVTIDFQSLYDFLLDDVDTFTINSASSPSITMDSIGNSLVLSAGVNSSITLDEDTDDIIVAATNKMSYFADYAPFSGNNIPSAGWVIDTRMEQGIATRTASLSGEDTYGMFLGAMLTFEVTTTTGGYIQTTATGWDIGSDKVAAGADHRIRFEGDPAKIIIGNNSTNGAMEYDIDYGPFTNRQIPDSGWVSSNFLDVSGSVTVDATPVSTHKVQVNIGGTDYYIYLEAV